MFSDVFKAAMRKCHGVFDNIYNKCMNELPAVVDLLCNLVRLHGLCDVIKSRLEHTVVHINTIKI